MKSEKEYIIELKAGKAQAFERLYEMYSGKLYNFCLKLSDGDRFLSEDVVQSVFVKIWETRSRIDENKSFLSYIFTIAKNNLLNRHAHKTIAAIYNHYIKCSGIEFDNCTENDVNAHLLEEYIETLIEKMPPARRKIFILSRKDGKSNKDISKLLGISESTVETQLGQAKKFVRDCVKSHYDLCLWLLAIVFWT